MKGAQVLDCLEHEDHLQAGLMGLIRKQVEAQSRMSGILGLPSLDVVFSLGYYLLRDSLVGQWLRF